MATLAPKLKFAILFLVEVHTPIQEFLNGLRGFRHNSTHGVHIAKTGPGIQSIRHMLLKAIVLIHHGGNAALSLGRTRDEGITLAQNNYLTMFRSTQGKAQPCHAAAYYQKVRCNHRHDDM